MPAILDALGAHTTPEGAARYRCKVGRWLDSLEGEPGHDELVAAFEAPSQARARTARQLEAIAARLGHPISDKTIGDHRAGRCRCSW